MRRAWVNVIVGSLLAWPVCAAAEEDPSTGSAFVVAQEPPPPAEEPEESPFVITGYVDVGAAYAQGNGTSWPAGDTRIPADYVADPFATAVNSRGDVASINSNGRFVNGFLPRSVGIGGKPSFLINTVNVDLRYTPKGAPVMVFVRGQFMPRFGSGPDVNPSGLPPGNQTRVYIEQAFGRVIPFNTQEFALSVGKFDSVFGIEYLENQANIRTGITPSLLARYTTGQALGAKGFYRVQIPAAWSAVSLNVAATNNGTRVESLQPSDLSFTGVPVASGRLGYELNLQKVTFKLGFSGLYGPRNDQTDLHVHQWMVGMDARLYVAGFSVEGELLRSFESPGAAAIKYTGLGEFFAPSGFKVEGYWTQVGYTFSFDNPVVQAFTLYGRFERRNGTFDGFATVRTSRYTAGFRLDLYRCIAIKAEALLNNELPGTPQVANNVFTSSVVYTF